MSEPSPPEPDPSESQVLKAQFGRYWRAWRWVRAQFTPASLSALGALLVTGGGYIVHLRQDVAVVRERVVVLETRVVPVLRDETDVTAIKVTLEDHEKRITRLEQDYDYAQQEAGTPPVVHRRRHP